ncbi:MAG: DNA polymerase III subunit delta' [Nitrospirota bacterium]
MSFNSIIGHTIPKRILQSAIKRERIGDAYLFIGEEGIGKRLTAINFAKAIYCREIKDDSCNICSTCHRIDMMIYPNITLIEPEGNFIKIAQVRNIKEDIGYRTIDNGRKIYIIDYADRMNQEASNSFLKTLEEPEGNSTIILITSRPYRLIPTITSRCQVIKFNPLSIDHISDILISKKGISQRDARFFACLSEGKIGKALEMDREIVRAERDKILKIFSDSLLASASSLFRLASEFSKDRETMENILLIISIYLRDILVFKEAREESLLINQDMISEITLIRKRISSTEIMDIICFIHGIVISLSRNINKELAMGELLMRIRETIKK